MTGLVAVTGATGFLGRYIVRELIEQGWRVRILARGYPVHEQFQDLAFEVVPGDLSDLDSLRALVREADCIVHAAGLIKARDAQAFHKVNVQGTANLLAALEAHHAHSRLLMVSSLAARAPHLSPYAATKRAAEDHVRASAHDWIIIRPCAVYGPWDVETLTVLKAVSLGISPRPGHKNARVGLVHARDVAGAVGALCARGEPGGDYEITDARCDGYSWAEITQAAAKVLGSRTIAVPISGWVMRCAGAAGSILGRFGGPPAMLTIDKVREILHPDWSCMPENQPPKQLWRPKIDLNCGFLETIRWYQARGWLPVARKSDEPD